MVRKIEFDEHILDNGLTCILHKNSKNPLINLTLGYKVGSKDERPGKKGIAHLFEHMMFQGSENISKTEHFTYIQKLGGNCNAFTMQDLTAYHETLPSNQIETALWLESDRMNSLNISEENLANQKQVVIEEKKQRYDNSPYGTALLNIYKNVFTDSPYESPVIGFEEDINSFSVDEAVTFHNKYYSPQNAVLFLTGDFDESKILKTIDAYFGNIKNKDNPDEMSKFSNRELKESKKIIVKDKITLPGLFVCYKIPEYGSFEEYTFEYLTTIISNSKSSRLYKKLVYEKNIVKSIYTAKMMLKHCGVLFFRSIVNDPKDIDYVEKCIHEELNSIAENGVTEEEFEKVKNEIEFQNVTNLFTLKSIALNNLINTLYFNDPDLINTKIDKFLEVKIDDIKKTVNDWFVKKHNFIMHYLPDKSNINLI
jgi:zinc protease